MIGSIVVIAASTGGLEPLRAIMSKLPVPCAASIFVVWHIGQHASVLPSILSSASKLPARFAQGNARIEPGYIYVAPPDHHVVLTAGHMHLNRDPKVNLTRPAADPLFASAAEAYREQVLGIVLNGVARRGGCPASDTKDGRSLRLLLIVWPARGDKEICRRG